MEIECPEEFKCPICFEIPQDKIFQCKNGHTVCNGCSTGLTECPQCRVKFSQDKIRNRALESLIKTMKLHGGHEESGKRNFSNATRPKSTHNSPYSCSINFCELLGYSCAFELDTRNMVIALAHFKKFHDFILHKAPTVNIHLEGIMEFDQTRKSAWTPVILDLTSKHGVILAILSTFNNEDNTISLTSIKLSESMALKDIRTEFTIAPLDQLKTPNIVWNAPPTTLRQTWTALQLAPFRISVDALKKFYLKDGELIITCSIASFAEHREPVKAENLYVFNLPHDNEIKKENPSSSDVPKAKAKKAPPPPPPRRSGYHGYTFQGVGCDVCGEMPLKTVRYKCLQCTNYDICKVCMEKNEHELHLFAVIRNEKQNDKISELVRSPSVKPSLIFAYPFSPNESEEILPSLESMICPMSGCRNLRSFICLQCRPLFGYCKDCFYKYSSSHSEDHIFLIANTVGKIKLVFQNLRDI